MRKLHSYRRLNRDHEHRRALLMNLTEALFRNEAIRTTVPKAKEVRRYAEKLISRARKDSTHNRRLVHVHLHDLEVLNKLFAELGPRYSARPGGYTRILRLANRPGDNASMAMLELVDRPEKVVEPKAEEPVKAKKAKKEAAAAVAASA